MDVNRVIEAMRIHTSDRAYGRVFVLGCYERRVTIYSQQVRALNLVHALFATNRLRDGGRLVVIGGGVAGLTAAAAANRRGVQVTLLEREPQVLALFRRPARRWLHPGVYDWPFPGWNRHSANLPLMTWSAGLLPDIVSELHVAWKKEGAGVNVVTGAADIVLHPDEREPRVTWNAPGSKGGHRPCDGKFDSVVLAVGFGREPISEKDRGYWQPDDIDDSTWFDPASDKPRSWLVTGCGDGGLTEVFRLCLNDFRHERILEEFLSDPRIDPFVAEIRRIEADPRAMDPDKGPEFLTDEYRTLAAPFLVERLTKLRRKDTQVWLNGTGPNLFDPRASAANRFLLAQLLHAEAFRYLPGRIESTKKVGDRVQVQCARLGPREFDRYVCRHGPMSAMEEYFRDLWQHSLHLRETWKHAPHLLDHTRTRIWTPGEFGPEEVRLVMDPSGPANVADLADGTRLASKPRQNPYHTAGTLPPGHPTYIDRSCDVELDVALRSRSLMAVEGDFSTGKSSLLLKAYAGLDETHQTCLVDLQGLRMDDEHIFMRDFFDDLTLKLGRKVDSWLALDDPKGPPLALLLDEFGVLAGRSAQGLIPQLVHFAVSRPTRVRVVVCLPVRQRGATIHSFLTSVGIDRKKFHAPWQRIKVPLFQAAEIDRLLGLLPIRACSLARANSESIDQLSGGFPMAVQRVCSALFDADIAGASESSLRAIVMQKSTYEG